MYPTGSQADGGSLSHFSAIQQGLFCCCGICVLPGNHSSLGLASTRAITETLPRLGPKLEYILDLTVCF